MKTLQLDANETQLEQAAEILKNGGLVAFPTETVYGLGANGLDGVACKKIFAAKGRPADNPLILHIHSVDCIKPLVKEVTHCAKTLMDNFWPGPMTLIFKKNDVVPDEVTAGLDSVAIRFPINKIAKRLIQLADLPIAAPSANSSGRPSPTKAEHVYEDLNGKIDAIIDGGSCDIGLESTVIDVTEENPVILRPGKISLDDIKKFFPNAEYDRHLIDRTSASKPRSPGMKYKHYAPKGELYVVTGKPEKIREYILEHINQETGIMNFDEFILNCKNEFSLGGKDDTDSAGHRLFDILRQFDTIGMKTIYAFMPKDNNMSFAVLNRLLKAAGGKIIDTEEN